MTNLRRTWEREVMGRLLDHSMKGVDGLRAELLKDVRGRVVEIGFGTGANLPFYPHDVTELVAVEPSEGLVDRARDRLVAWGRPHTIVAASATQALPLDAHSFDAVVITFVLCSVPDVAAVLREAARLLKPGAPLFLAEHVAGSTPGVRLVQRAMRPFSQAVAGCDPTRNTGATFASLGWDTHELHSQTLELLPPMHPGLVGIARPPRARS